MSSALLCVRVCDCVCVCVVNVVTSSGSLSVVPLQKFPPLARTLTLTPPLAGPPTSPPPDPTALNKQPHLTCHRKLGKRRQHESSRRPAKDHHLSRPGRRRNCGRPEGGGVGRTSGGTRCARRPREPWTRRGRWGAWRRGGAFTVY